MSGGLRIGALTQDEIDELDCFLHSGLTSSETLMIDALDGYLTALAIGPGGLKPLDWLPGVWGPTPAFAPSFDSNEQAIRIKSLIIRHFNGIFLNFLRDPAGFEPLFNVTTLATDSDEHIDGAMWAFGFMRGVALCIDGWKPLLASPDGERWLRPVLQLSRPSVGDDAALMQQREQWARETASYLKDIDAWFRPARDAKTAVLQGDLPGRNDPCWCGSGLKFKKCCGNPAVSPTMH